MHTPAMVSQNAIMDAVNFGTQPEGGNAKDSFCYPLHFSIPGKGPLPVCSGRPSVGRHTLLQLPLADLQFLLLDQQALDVCLDLHVHLQILTRMSPIRIVKLTWCAGDQGCFKLE